MERLDGLKRSHTFWNYTCNLKHDLVGLFGNNSTQEARDEADRIAKAVIEELYAISQRYDIAASALIQNFLINVGAKEKGRCYHYVSDLRAALSGVPMKQFELYWGEAFAGTFRENNALVISVKGKTFGDGIAIDAWRSAGKPFWTPVRGDRFPWKEAPNIAYE
jgi:hypothetical protein